MPVPKVFVLERVDCILGLQPRDKAAMVGVNTIEFFSKNLRGNRV